MHKDILRGLIFAGLVLLGGCRILVEVDTGGSVTSLSGNGDCPGGNCIINVPPGAYNETFTAVPAPGYSFAGWGGWCAAFQTPTCTVSLTPELTAYDFDGDIIAHFNAPIVGAWIEGDISSADGFAIVTFYPNGAFVVVQSCSAEDGASNPDGGYEQGTYTWNPDTGAFATTVRSDSIGGCGFHEQDGSMSFDRIEIDGNVLTLYQGAVAEVTLNRIVPDQADGLTGSWTVGDARFPAEFAQLTFVDGQYYVLALECLDGDGGPRPPGMEYGTYIWSSRSKSVRFSPVRVTSGDCAVGTGSSPITVLKRPWLGPNWGRAIIISEADGTDTNSLTAIR